MNRICFGQTFNMLILLGGLKGLLGQSEAVPFWPLEIPNVGRLTLECAKSRTAQLIPGIQNSNHRTGKNKTRARLETKKEFGPAPNTRTGKK